MKKLLTGSQGLLPDIILLVIRVLVGMLMINNGIPKLQMLMSGGPIEFPSVFGMGAKFSLILTIFSEVGCSILLLVGFLTRFAALPLVITMLVAALVVNWSSPLAQKESALLYALIYLPLYFAGAGRYSLDGFLQTRRVVSGGVVSVPHVE